jgi:hypothetical protein
MTLDSRKSQTAKRLLGELGGARVKSEVGRGATTSQRGCSQFHIITTRTQRNTRSGPSEQQSPGQP